MFTAKELEALKLLAFNKGYASGFVKADTYKALMDKKLIRFSLIPMKFSLTAAGKKLIEE